jgi:hypothetical protein
MTLKRSWVVASLLAGLCMASPTLSDAARSGSYRCLFAVPEGGAAWVTHYNPNGNAQTITRVRVWDGSGTLVWDTGPFSAVIPANGTGIALVIDGTVEGFVPDAFQVLVNWSQSLDKPGPLPRADMLPDGTFTSSVRTPCP